MPKITTKDLTGLNYMQVQAEIRSIIKADKTIERIRQKCRDMIAKQEVRIAARVWEEYDRQKRNRELARIAEVTGFGLSPQERLRLNRFGSAVEE